MLKPTALIVINKNAGSINLEELTSRLDVISQSENFAIEYFHTTGENDKRKMEARLSKKLFDRVIVAGGDGTVNMMASVVIKKNLPMAIIPSGSANGLAANLSIPTNLDDQLKTAFGNNTMAIDCLEVNKELCLHIADLGLNAELIRNFDNAKLRGKLGYVLHAIPTLFNANYPYKFKIHLNDQILNRKGVLLAIANASKFGMGTTINPKGFIDDGKFEVILFKTLNIITIFKTFIYKKPILDPDEVENYCVEKVTIECKHKVALQVDGEFKGSVNKVTAKVFGEKLRIFIA